MCLGVPSSSRPPGSAPPADGESRDPPRRAGGGEGQAGRAGARGDLNPPRPGDARAPLWCGGAAWPQAPQAGSAPALRREVINLEFSVRMLPVPGSPFTSVSHALCGQNSACQQAVTCSSTGDRRPRQREREGSARRARAWGFNRTASEKWESLEDALVGQAFPGAGQEGACTEDVCHKHGKDRGRLSPEPRVVACGRGPGRTSSPPPPDLVLPARKTGCGPGSPVRNSESRSSDNPTVALSL